MRSVSRRYSCGGSVVARSLEAADFRLDTPGVSLVETDPPRLQRPTTVLAQSAWNVLPMPEFVRLLGPYPARMQARAMARRQVARVNLRRARKVVCLTDAMSAMTERFAHRDVHVAPVCLPRDAVNIPRRRPTADTPPVAVVPGTITWYKRPGDALKWVGAHPELGIQQVRLIGPDDGSGCLSSVLELAGRLQLEATAGHASRDELWAALAAAHVVVLPSALESLGFALGEALWIGSRVVASSIPAHVEVADRLQARPEWINGHPVGTACRRGVVDDGQVVAQWRQLGRTLGLAEAPQV